MPPQLDPKFRRFADILVHGGDDWEHDRIFRAQHIIIINMLMPPALMTVLHI